MDLVKRITALEALKGKNDKINLEAPNPKLIDSAFTKIEKVFGWVLGSLPRTNAEAKQAGYYFGMGEALAARMGMTVEELKAYFKFGEIPERFNYEQPTQPRH